MVIKSVRETVEDIIRNYLPTEEYVGYDAGFMHRSDIVPAMRYAMEAGGKRIRPTIMYLTYLSLGGNDEKLMRALSIACADEFLPELENGLDTLLGERGTGLSEGQMQRLAIARAIFADSPILLLDEATSALDEETEKRLLHNLRSLTDKIVIIVTHRKAVLSICDRVLAFTESGVEEA